MSEDIGRKIERMVRDIADVEVELGAQEAKLDALLDRTDLANLDLDDLRSIVGRYVGIVQLTRIEFRHLADVMVAVCQAVGVWPDAADAIVEHVEHLIEERPARWG